MRPQRQEEWELDSGEIRAGPTIPPAALRGGWALAREGAVCLSCGSSCKFASWASVGRKVGASWPGGGSHSWRK